MGQCNFNGCYFERHSDFIVLNRLHSCTLTTGGSYLNKHLLNIFLIFTTNDKLINKKCLSEIQNTKRIDVIFEKFAQVKLPPTTTQQQPMLIFFVQVSIKNDIHD